MKTTCDECGGSGRIHSHNDICDMCGGKGWLSIGNPRSIKMDEKVKPLYNYAVHGEFSLHSDNNRLMQFADHELAERIFRQLVKQTVEESLLGLIKIEYIRLHDNKVLASFTKEEA